MEGCGSCNCWGRLVKSYGHEVRVISPKKIKGFLQGQKTDAYDALAIAIAVMPIGMTFSPIKGVDQQSLQTLETSRKFLSNELVELGSPLCAFLYTYRVTAARGRKSLTEAVPAVLNEQDSRLPKSLKNILMFLQDRYNLTKNQLTEVTESKASLVKQLEPCNRLMDLEGVGEV